MSPLLAIVVLGAGAGVVWFLTQDAQGAGTGPAPAPAPSYPVPNVPAPIGGSGGTSWDPSIIRDATDDGPDWLRTLGTVGGLIASVGLWIWNARRNTTFEARIEFAERLGAGDGRAAYDKLLDVLRSIGRDDLAHVALNVIGRKDDQMNQRWMSDVLAALQQALNLRQWNGKF